MEPEVKKVRRNPFIGTKIASGKAEFEARMKTLDPNLAKAMIAGTIQSVDYALYAVRHLGADTTIELMQASDTQKVGLTNMNNRKLDANNYALVKGIQLLMSSEKVAATDSALQGATFGKINSTIANGDFELKQGDKTLIPRTSCEVFCKGGDNSLVGYYALECPKMLAPLTEIVPTLYVPVAVNDSQTPANSTVAKIVFHCVKTNKA